MKGDGNEAVQGLGSSGVPTSRYGTFLGNPSTAETRNICIFQRVF